MARRFLPKEQRPKFLLISLVLFLFLVPILEGDPWGEIFLILNMYFMLVASTLELKEKQGIFFSAVPVAATSMILQLASHLNPVRPLVIANSLVLTMFFGMVSVALFTYLGRKGEVAAGRIYVSVSLYFLIGMCWFSLYKLVNVLHPGSFAEGGAVLNGRVPGSTMVYFSFATLTTVGYGDIVAVTPVARMLSVLEATAGVLYIAITVARLVGSTQISKSE